jgi:hypothetical protein
MVLIIILNDILPPYDKNLPIISDKKTCKEQNQINAKQKKVNKKKRPGTRPGLCSVFSVW